MIDPQEFLRHHPAKQMTEDGELISSAPEQTHLSFGVRPTSYERKKSRKSSGNTDFGPRLFDGADARHPKKKSSWKPVSEETDKGALYDRCMKSALRSLEAADTSTGGLRQRLHTKDFDDEMISKVIATLERTKLIDDAAFAASYLSKCLDKMMGPMAVRREMARKGVEADVSKRLIQAAQEDGRFEDSARRLVESVDAKTRSMSYEKRMRRLAATARRKGHSMQMIRSVGRVFFER